MDILLCPEKKTRSDVPKRDWPRISQNLWIRSVELWCWRRLLRVPWTTRRSNQSILNEISPEYSLEGLMLRLKLQYFGHLMRRADSLGKTLMLGKIEGRRRRGQQRMRWLDSITNSMDMNLNRLQEMVKDRAAWHAAIHGVTRSWTQLSNWPITATICSVNPFTRWYIHLRLRKSPVHFQIFQTPIR